MNDELNNYLQDLVYLIKEEYNDALKSSSEAISERDKIYQDGRQIAYYQVLNLIEHQLVAFDIESDLIDKIVPEFGHKAEF